MVNSRFDRADLAGRIRQVRVECYGPGGIEELAAELDVPSRTWKNYESGVTIPGIQLLGFIVRTKVNPAWLLTGDGEQFSAGASHLGSDGRGQAGSAGQEQRSRI